MLILKNCLIRTRIKTLSVCRMDEGKYDNQRRLCCRSSDNYYSTQQILSIVDADAQNQQTEILKDLATFDYNYFGKTTGGEG